MLDQINTSLLAGQAAFSQTFKVGGTAGAADGSVGTTAAGNTITHTDLVRLQALYGDAGQNVKAFVMHSKVYYDLMKQSISDNVYNVAGVTIHEGSVATLGKPVIVTDSRSLLAGNGTTGDTTNHAEYFTMALTSGAIQVEESEDRQIVSDLITGLENLVLRYQGEYAYTVKLKGYTYNEDATTRNPKSDNFAGPTTAADINHAANWTQTGVAAGQEKTVGGARLITA